MLPALADVVGVAADEVFYAWTVHRERLLRRCGQHGPLGQTGWIYFFHGFECDLSHDDGRLLRFDFGPGGRVDTFTAWGVLQFIMTSIDPWPEYPELKQQFAQLESRTNRFGGDTRVMYSVWGRLEARGAFEPADRALVEFEKRYTAVEADGLRHVRFPPGTPETTAIDCSVAHRPILSAIGQRLLDEAQAAVRAG
jgi:hypothetical protein